MFIVIRLINKSPRSLLFADNEIKLKLFSCFPTRSLTLHGKKSTNLWQNGNKNKKLFAIKTSSLPDFLQSARCDGPAAVKLFVNSAISLCHWTLFDAALMPSAHSHSYFYDIAFAQLLILFFFPPSLFCRSTLPHMKPTLINPSTSRREKPVSCNLPECIYVSILAIPKCIVRLSLSLSFRSLKMCVYVFSVTYNVTANDHFRW